jgi:DNA-binding LytR/AlgR family response regulator
MKASHLFKVVALASAGAYAYHFFKENPSLFTLQPTNEEKAKDLIDRLQNQNVINSDVAGLAYDVVNFGGNRYSRSNVIDVKPSEVRYG